MKKYSARQSLPFWSSLTANETDNPRRLVDCDDDSDIGSYSYTYLSHLQGRKVRFILYPLSFLLHKYVCQNIVMRKVFSSVHLDGAEFHHSPDNQLLQSSFVPLIYLTHEQQVALPLQSLTQMCQCLINTALIFIPARPYLFRYPAR